MKSVMGTLAVLALAGTASAQTINAAGGNARYVLNAGTAGVPSTSTAIGGGSANLFKNQAVAPDHLFENWWWYRVDGVNTREYRYSTSADGFGSPGSAFAAAGDTMTATFNFANFRSELRYVITDPDNLGVNTAHLAMTNKITNTDSVARSINIFAYADFDLSGVLSNNFTYNAAEQRIEVRPNPAPGNGKIAYFKGFGATAYQAAPFTSTNGTAVRGLVSDTDIDNLNNTIVGSPGDYSGAVQWTFTLQPGEMMELLAVLSVNTVPVPTPGAVALFGLAGLAGLRRRR